tara:strand:- start:4 stop:309 length:306 start_codon:yes stop_codon:yes gene_type:complete
MSTLPEKFINVNMNELPKDQAPKFKVGDLVYIRPGAIGSEFGFYLKDGMGVIIEVCAFKVLGYDYYKPQSIYVIEYKISRVGGGECCHVLEGSLSLTETGV